MNVYGTYIVKSDFNTTVNRREKSGNYTGISKWELCGRPAKTKLILCPFYSHLNYMGSGNKLHVILLLDPHT